MRLKGSVWWVLAVVACVGAWFAWGGVARAAGDGGAGSIRPGGGPDRRADLTPEQVDEVMAFVQSHFPIAYNVLGRVEQRNPRAFHRRIQHMAPRIMEMRRAMEDDPPIGRLLIADFRLESEIIQLRHRYRQGRDAGEKRELRDTLEVAIAQQFDVQLQRQRLMIERLANRLDGQRRRVEKQVERRDQIINERLQDALHGQPAGED